MSTRIMLLSRRLSDTSGDTEVVSAIKEPMILANPHRLLKKGLLSTCMLLQADMGPQKTASFMSFCKNMRAFRPAKKATKTRSFCVHS